MKVYTITLFLAQKVLKYTKSKAEKELLSSAIKAFVVSLSELSWRRELGWHHELG